MYLPVFFYKRVDVLITPMTWIFNLIIIKKNFYHLLPFNFVCVKFHKLLYSFFFIRIYLIRNTIYCVVRCNKFNSNGGGGGAAAHNNKIHIKIKH